LAAVTLEVAVVAFYRVVGSLPTLKWPLAGGLFAIFVDLTDLFWFNVLDLGGVPDYQMFDKLADQVYLAVFLIVALRWTGPERAISVVLYAFRILGFVLSELPHRKEFAYPPYGRLVRIVLAHKSYAQVHAVADELVRLLTALTEKLSLPIRVHGPIPPPMERIMEQYRVEIILFSDSALPLQRLLASLRARGALQSGRAGGVALTVDVDPLHML